jgi:hypothetical protein
MLSNLGGFTVTYQFLYSFTFSQLRKRKGCPNTTVPVSITRKQLPSRSLSKKARGKHCDQRRYAFEFSIVNYPFSMISPRSSPMYECQLLRMRPERRSK